MKNRCPENREYTPGPTRRNRYSNCAPFPFSLAAPRHRRSAFFTMLIPQSFISTKFQHRCSSLAPALEHRAPCQASVSNYRAHLHRAVERHEALPVGKKSGIGCRRNVRPSILTALPARSSICFVLLKTRFDSVCQASLIGDQDAKLRPHGSLTVPMDLRKTNREWLLS